MLDSRLLYTLLHARQRELEEQAARDRLAASQRAERHALGRLLTAAGTALLALGTRLHGAPAPAPEHVSDRRLVEANGHSAQLDAESDTPLGLTPSGFSRPAGDGFRGGADTSPTGSAVRDGGAPAEPFWRQ
jgi:hypothetical protein